MAAEPAESAAVPGRPTATRGEGYVLRFGATERSLHAIHSSAFTVMFATGLVLYVPALAQIFSSRPAMKAIHLTAAVCWLTALALVAILGDRRALRRTRREIEHLDADDLRWLRSRGGGGVPQGRFNAGQKLHAVAQAALAVLFTVSGVLLLLGERDTAWRLPGTIALHDMATLVAGVLVAGHVWMAISPRGLPAIRGILRGSVPAAWAAEHHPKWVPPETTDARHGAGRSGHGGPADGRFRHGGPDPRRTGSGRPGSGRLAAAAVALAAGAWLLAALVFT